MSAFFFSNPLLKKAAAIACLLLSPVAFAAPVFTQPIQSSSGQASFSSAAAGVVGTGNSSALIEWSNKSGVVSSQTVAATNDWKTAAAGASHVLAIKTDGSLWSWGKNSHGQLGDGTQANRNAPVRVGGDSDWVKVFASGTISGAIKTDGSFWFWGGSGMSENLLSPQKLDSIVLWDSVSFGTRQELIQPDPVTSDFALLLSKDGRLFLRDTTGPLRQLGSAADWAAVSVGGNTDSGVIGALKFDGSLWRLSGAPQADAAGSENGGFYKVGGSSRYTSLSAGGRYAVALREDGTLWALGSQPENSSDWSVFRTSSYGWNAVNHDTPVQIGTRSDWVGVSAGIVPVAVDKTGKVFWAMEASEVEVEQPRVPCAAVYGICDPDNRSPQGVARGLDGTLWAWGGNSAGQLGNYDSSGTWDWSSSQVGVDARWGLEGVVRGIPVALVLGDLPQDTLTSAYSVKVNGTSAGGTLFGEWTTHPTPAKLATGATISLSASLNAGADTPTTYQWFRNGTLIAGQTSANYTLSKAQPSSSGVYTLAVSSGNGTTVRSEAVPVVVEDGTLAAFHADLATVATDLSSTNPSRFTNARTKYASASARLGTIIGSGSIASTGTIQTACVLKALADLYLLTSDPDAQSTLTTLGFTGSSDPRNFTLNFPAVPSVMKTGTLRANLTGPLYTKLTAVDTLLGKVTDKALLGALSDSDLGKTSGGFTPYDYGDVQALRAGLNFFMAWIKWIETQNTDMDLAALKADMKAGLLSLEFLLGKYPDLFNASATASAAQKEFVLRLGNTLTCYLAFSDFANPLSNTTGPKRVAPTVAIVQLDSLSQQLSENVFRQNCLKFQASIATSPSPVAAGLKDFYPGMDRSAQEVFTASPSVFVNHTPGWRSELPAFSGNAYKVGSFKPETPIATYPALSSLQLGAFEKSLQELEPRLNKQWKTGRETTPPIILSTLTITSGTQAAIVQAGTQTLTPASPSIALTSTGWITVSGTISDNSGISRVFVANTIGAEISLGNALFLERPRVQGAPRTYDWSVQLPSAGTAGGTVASLSIKAEDARGNSAIPRYAALKLTAPTSPVILPTIPPISQQAYFEQGYASLSTYLLASGTASFHWKKDGTALSAPATAVAVDDWAAVGAGSNHTLAIKRNGTLWAWGANSANQLGDGTSSSKNAPVQIGSARNWAAVSGGGTFSVAIRRDGTLWVWGFVVSKVYDLPTQVGVGIFWAAVSAGREHVLLLDRDGRLYSFGSNSSGQLGLGSNDSKELPVQIGTTTDWVEISAGASASFGIKKDGSLWAWGNGNLGTGWWSQTLSPVRVGQDSDWSSVSTLRTGSAYFGNDYTAAVKKDGTLWVWGSTPGIFSSGENFFNVPKRLLDTNITAGRNGFASDWASVAAGDNQVLARRRDGSVFRVGDDWATPVAEPGSTVSLSVGQGFNATLGKDGRLWTWGNNWSGQLGNFKPRDLQEPWQYYAETYSSTPVQVGVNSDWGLSAPVSGIPLPLSVGPLSSGSLGLYVLTVTQGTATTTGSATLYDWNTQPDSQRLIAGSRLSLTSSLSTGTAAASYQWVKNGTLAAGTASTLTISSSSPTDAGVYQLRATSSGAAFLGQPVPVTVDSANVALARVALARKDYPEASNRINAALAANANDGTALLLRSALDLYNLWSDPATSSTLAALGLSGSADPWNFSLAFSPTGFPKGALSSTARDWLLINLYPKLAAAEGNLGKITVGFLTTLRASEISPSASPEDVIVDYGDIVLLRSILNGFMAGIKWIETQNTDVDFSALQNDRTNGRLSVESILAKYPILLAASKTGDAARTEFVSRSKNALTNYQAFSDFVNPASGVTASKRVSPSLGTARLEEESQRVEERSFRDIVNKTLSSIQAADAVAGQRTIVFKGGTANIVLSPYVFFNHAPGWRADLPRFFKNRYIPNTLNRPLLKSAYPGLFLNDIAQIEASLSGAEADLNKKFGTRADNTAPIVSIAPPAPAPAPALTSYDGWVTLEGTASDPSGVRSVTITTVDGTTRESYDAILDARPSDAAGNRVVHWTVSIALPTGVTGTLKYEASARDYLGGFIDLPVTQSLAVLRKVPFTVSWQGPGSLTYNITPAADDDGFVTLGAKVALSAIPSPGGILRRIETIIDGESLPVDPSRPPATSLTITGETILTAIFETNPYLLIGGRNKVAGGLLSPETGDFTIFGIFPLSAMQVAVTPSGGLSGKLLVGRNTYSFSGRFDGDGIYSTTLTGYIPCLDWNPQVWNPQNPAARPTTLPKVRQLPISIRLWVDTANGPETPVLRTFLAESHGVSLAGTLTPQADADYTGKPLFTGSFGKNSNLQIYAPALWSTPKDGAPEGGYFSISARKSGSAVAMGALPNGEKFTSSTRLTNRNGGHSDLEFLAPTGTNGVFAFFTTLPQPEGTPLINGYFARREAWYSGARGPVFVSEAKQSTPVFAAEWTPTGAAFTLATAGQTLVPFATQSDARTIPLSLQPTGSPTVQKAFSVQSVNRNSVSVVPDSVQPGFSSAVLSLSQGSGLLSGSVLVTNGKIRKRITLQGVLLQGASSGWLGRGVTSDGQQFVLGESPHP